MFCHHRSAAAPTNSDCEAAPAEAPPESDFRLKFAFLLLSSASAPRLLVYPPFDPLSAWALISPNATRHACSSAAVVCWIWDSRC